jgi:hypothetical protein
MLQVVQRADQDRKAGKTEGHSLCHEHGRVGPYPNMTRRLPRLCGGMVSPMSCQNVDVGIPERQCELVRPDRDQRERHERDEEANSRADEARPEAEQSGTCVSELGPETAAAPGGRTHRSHRESAKYASCSLLVSLERSGMYAPAPIAL